MPKIEGKERAGGLLSQIGKSLEERHVEQSVDPPPGYRILGYHGTGSGRDTLSTDGMDPKKCGGCLYYGALSTAATYARAAAEQDRKNGTPSEPVVHPLLVPEKEKLNKVPVGRFDRHLESYVPVQQPPEKREHADVRSVEMHHSCVTLGAFARGKVEIGQAVPVVHKPVGLMIAVARGVLSFEPTAGQKALCVGILKNFKQDFGGDGGG